MLPKKDIASKEKRYCLTRMPSLSAAGRNGAESPIKIIPSVTEGVFSGRIMTGKTKSRSNYR